MKIDQTLTGGNELFLDALSEPFRPPHDEEGNTHTLSRLAYAARSKGLLKQAHNSPILRYNYPPTRWAPGTVATAYYLSRFDGQFQTLTGIGLGDEDGELVSVHGRAPLTYTGEPQEADLVLNVNGSQYEYELELGEKLMVARLAVAQCAQNFFEQMA